MLLESAGSPDGARVRVTDLAPWRRNLLASSGRSGDVGGAPKRLRRNRIVAGVQSAYQVPGDTLIMYVEHLEAVPLHLLGRVRAVFYMSKGMNCHVEVACRIKGIPLVRTEALVFDQGAQASVVVPELIAPADAVLAYKSVTGGFQASVFDSSDIEGIDMTRLETVFLRLEHYAYRAYQPDLSHDEIIAEAEELLRNDLQTLDRELPRNVRIVIRVLDVRSDDPTMGSLLFAEQERNPELGFHGTRYHLIDRRWCEMTARCAADIASGRVQIASPFITTTTEYIDFHRTYEDLFRGSEIIPFVESPAFLGEAASYIGTAQVCVGLKDLAQFYFAADRGRDFANEVIDYADRGLLDLIKRALVPLTAAGVPVSIYQSMETLPTYQQHLDGLLWVPSMPAHDLALLAAGSK